MYNSSEYRIIFSLPLSLSVLLPHHFSYHPVCVPSISPSMLNSPLHFIYYIRKYRAQPCHPVASKFFHRRKRRKGKKVENSVCKNDSFSTHQFRRTLKKRCSVVSFQKERKRERRRGVLINPPPQTLAWIYYSPPSSPSSIDSIHFLGRVSRDRFELPEIEKKRKEKKKGEKRNKKGEKERGGKLLENFSTTWIVFF